MIAIHMLEVVVVMLVSTRTQHQQDDARLVSA